MRIYITGISGLLGSSLENELKNKHEIFGCDIVSNWYEGIDITNYNQLEKSILKVDPDIIINCAAIIGVGYCERNPNIANSVNVNGINNIIEIINKNKLKIKIIHIGTHSIFNGNIGNYLESDSTSPINVYSVTKALSEFEVSKNINNLILRINLFGDTDKNFVGLILKGLNENKEIKLYDNIFINPLHVNDIAGVVSKCIDKKLEGLYHIGSIDSASKYEIGLKICKLLNKSKNLIKSMKYDNEKELLKRPLKCTVNVEKINKIIKMPTIDESLKNII